jgi:hypothetical protein
VFGRDLNDQAPIIFKQNVRFFLNKKMPKKFQIVFVTLSVVIAILSLWTLVILILNYTGRETVQYHDMIILPEPDDQKILTVPTKVEKQQTLQLSVDFWLPKTFRLQRHAPELPGTSIIITVLENHFEVLQKNDEIKIVTDLSACPSFKFPKNHYIVNDQYLIWLENNVVQVVTGDNNKRYSIPLLVSVQELLGYCENSTFIWRGVDNVLYATGLLNQTTVTLFCCTVKPKCVVILGEVLCVLTEIDFTTHNLVNTVTPITIAVVADYILSPTLLLRLATTTEPSVILEKFGNNFITSSTNPNVDSLVLSDIFFLRQGQAVVLCDGQEGTFQLLGQNKYNLPMTNLTCVNVLVTNTNEYQVFLASEHTLYILYIIEGEVVSMLTRSDVKAVHKLTNGFIIQLDSAANYNCTVLPPNFANLNAKLC